jgi:hypothetical protein
MAKILLFYSVRRFFRKTIMLIPELIAAARSRSWELRVSSVILQEFVGSWFGVV